LLHVIRDVYSDREGFDAEEEVRLSLSGAATRGKLEPFVISVPVP